MELQIGGTDTWFEQRVEQLRNEIAALEKQRDSKLAELKSELQLVDRVLQFERQRFGPATPSGQSARASGSAKPNDLAFESPH